MATSDVTTKILDIQVRYKDAVDQLAAYRTAVTEAQARQKELKKDLDNGRISQQEYAREIETTRLFINQQNTAINTLTRQINNQHKAEQENEGSLVQWRAELSSLTAEYDRLGKAEREGAKGQELKNHINEVTDKLKEAEAATQRFQRNVGNYPDVVSGLKKQYESLVGTLANLRNEYGKLTDAEKASDNGQQLAKEINDVTEAARNAKTAIDEHNQSLRDAQSSIEESGGSTDNLTRRLRELVMEIASLTVEYRSMSDEEKQSAEGQELQKKIQSLTEEAGNLKDAIADTNVAISNAASDTRGFDRVSSAVKMMIDSFGFATGAAEMLGMKQEDLVKVQTQLQAALVASNAITQIQTNLQKESALMQGVYAVQAKAAAAAEAIKTAAQGKGTIATKAATVAQAAFNAVAKANPYVLLAGAIISVVGALAIFAKGSAEAKKREEERMKTMEEAKARQEEFRKSVVDSATAAIVKYFELRNAWIALGDSFAARKKFIDQNKDAFRQLGVVINKVGDAQKYLVEMTNLAIEALAKESVAKAFASNLDKQLQPYVDEWNRNRTFSMPNVGKVVGEKVSGGNGVIGHQGSGASARTGSGLTKEEFNAIKDLLSPGKSSAAGGGYSTTELVMSQEAYNVLKKMRNQQALNNQKNAIKQMEEISTSYAKFTADTQKQVSDIYKRMGITQENTPTKINASGPNMHDDSPKSSSSSTSASSSSSSANDEESRAKERARIELEALTNLQEELFKIQEDGAEKRRILTAYEYDKRIAALKRQLETEENLTETAKQAINDLITVIEKEKFDAMSKLSKEENQKILEELIANNEARLEIIEKGTGAQLNALLEEIEAERDERLKKAQYIEEEEKRDEEILKVTAEFEKKRLALIEDAQDTELGMKLANLDRSHEIAVQAMEDEIAIEQNKVNRLLEINQEAYDAMNEDEKAHYTLQLEEALSALNRKHDALKILNERYAYDEKVIREENAVETTEKQRQELMNQIANLQIAEDERLIHLKYGHEMSEEAYQRYKDKQLSSIAGFEAEKLAMEEEAARKNYEQIVERGKLTTQTQVEYDDEVIKAKQDWLNKQKAINDAYVKNEKAKWDAEKAVANGLISLTDAIGENSKSMAKASKIIALAQVAIDTGVAIAEGIKSASSVPFPGNIAAIASTIAIVVANTATAISTIKSAKFATGGKVLGPGSGTSDSIPAMLSNGEYVMTARATRLYEPLLAAMNSIGAGVPIQVANSYESVDYAEMMTDSFETAAREIKPVVSVVEITEAQERVNLIENLDNY